MALKYDERGFLIGDRQLKEMSQGITKTELNTRDILKVLSGSFGDSLKEQKKTNQTLSDTAQQQAKKRVKEAAKDNITNKVVASVKEVRDSVTETNTALKQQKRVLDAEYSQVKRSEQTKKRVESVKQRLDSVRDEKGHFVKADGSDGEQKQTRGMWGKIKNLLERDSGGMTGNTPDVRGFDPTIDALGELKDAVAPVGGVFGRMSAKTKNLFMGRTKRRKNDEVLPEEQSKALKEQRRNDVRRNTLLSRLIDAVRRNKNGGGLLGGAGGLLGGKGLLGSLKRGGKFLLKRAPWIGAILSGGLLAKDWGKMDGGQKGKGVGSIAGMTAGGALGSFLGPVGTVAGGALGYYLGGIFGEKVGEWTDSLKNINFADLFKSTLKDAFSVITAVGSIATMPARAVGGAVAGGISSVAGGIGNAYNTAKNYISDKIGFSGGEGSLKTRDGRQLGMYNALRKAGFSKSQALAIGGEIGRENDYGDAMFSTHIDPAKDKNGQNIRNGGVLSWNRERYKKFAAHMQSKGLMDANGRMPKTQAALDAQAEFIKKEMSESYSGKLKGFLENPDQDPKKAAADLAKYIGWARGQKTVRGANGTRVAFDSAKHERKINGYIDKGAVLAAKQEAKTAESPAAAQAKAHTAAAKSTAKPKEVAAIPKTIARPAKQMKLADVKPEKLRLTGAKMVANASSGPGQDVKIGQTVSDRNLAHIASGGIGFNSK